MMDNIAVGRRIRDARLSLGLTQEQLAEAAGLSATYISNLERGLQTARLDAFASICNALRCSSDILLQDVIDNSMLAQSNEISTLLNGQSHDIQQMLLAGLKAALTAYGGG